MHGLIDLRTRRTSWCGTGPGTLGRGIESGDGKWSYSRPPKNDFLIE